MLPVVNTVEKPSQYRAIERLHNGELCTIRAIHPDDKEALRRGMRRLSQQAAYFRFFQNKHDLTEAELAYFTELDFVNHVALGAALDDGDLAVGVGRYIAIEDEAELAFAVDDAHQGLGIGSLLLKHLVRIARAGGRKVLTANVLFGNTGMLRVFEHSSIPMKKEINGDCFKVTLALQNHVSVGY